MRYIFYFFFLMVAVDSFSQSKLSVNLIDTQKYKTHDLVKLDRILTRLENIINSSQFKDSLLSRIISNDNNIENLSNLQIYRKIIQGKEIYESGLGNSSMDLYLRLKPIPIYKPWTKVVGYTNKKTNYIFTYRRKFRKKCDADLIAHIAHEWTHKLGFDHLDEKTWNQSVPYIVQHIIENILKDKNYYK